MIELLKRNDYKSDILALHDNQVFAGEYILKKQFKLKPNVSFMLFTSHTPCKFMSCYLTLQVNFGFRNNFFKVVIAQLCLKLIIF
jgi:hypothetical protein